MRPAAWTAALLAMVVSACGGGPPGSFQATPTPPAPDYRQADAWLARPDLDHLARSTPAGLSAIDEAAAPADVFFIHPTTSSAKDVWNIPWDVSDADAPLNPVVLAGQVSVFNACCRLFAPRYRQASLSALGETRAMDLAYSDVAQAFRRFIADHPGDRPFIIASHSQGTAHAIRLLQEEVLGTPLQQRLVVAYLIGGYVPADFAEVGLPVCDAPAQKGCVVSWNASKPGSLLARIVIHGKSYWWRGRLRDDNQPPALCVNPLDWRAGDRREPVGADQNPGSLQFPHPPVVMPLPALNPHLTGARCHGGMLEVALPDTAGPGYTDDLARNFGSYHLNDYGLFYAALRANAAERIATWERARDW